MLNWFFGFLHILEFAIIVYGLYLIQTVLVKIAVA